MLTISHALQMKYHVCYYFTLLFYFLVVSNLCIKYNHVLFKKRWAELTGFW